MPALTVSGNEITDALRAAGVSGDGLSADSSFGIHEATTNLVVKALGTNPIAGGQLLVSGSTTITRTSLGDGWYRLETTGSGPPGGQPHGILRLNCNLSDLINGETYALSILWRNLSTPQAGGLDWCDTNFAFLDGEHPSFPGVWSTRDLGGGVKRTTVIGSRATYTSTFRFMDVTVYAGRSIEIKWPQVENQPLSTPYVGVSGGVRPVAFVRAPDTLIDGTQGWIAMRVRPWWPASSSPYPASDPGVWEYGNVSSSHRYGATFRNSDSRWNFFQVASGVVSSVQSSVQTFDRFDEVLLVYAWTATELKISVNGTPFVSIARSAIPNFATDTFFEMGRRAFNTNFPIDGDILWALASPGTITDSQVAGLYALTTDPPAGSGLPVSMLWPAVDANYTEPGQIGPLPIFFVPRIMVY